ncbi:MAG: RagB/SusD family nutrient uptake outer membrane protein [Bacteroidota bacterium]
MKKILFICSFALFVGLTSCEVEEVLNPNSPTIESFEDGATLADLKLLAHGLQAVIRQDMAFHFWTTSMIGREYYDLRGTDPRYTTELLGRNGGDLDNQGFLTTRSYFGRYRSARNANLLKTAVQNTAASLTASQSDALLGFANTIIGYELLLEATRQYENGIRLDVADVDNLGPFTNNFAEALNGIKSILDEGFGQLSGTQEEMVFNLFGFESIPVTDTEAVAQFNRAVLARVELYLDNKSGALSALGNSFMDLEGDLDIGAYYSFGGATGNDIANPLFYVPGVDNYMAHPTFVADAEEGDTRLSKVVDTGAEIAIDGLSSPFLVSIYESQTDQASIIRNEELILIYAEANIGGNNDEAVRAINIIRNAAGLDDYSGDTSDDALVDEVLMQRRYSLFGEGHRWIDLRRYNRLNELPLDRDGDKVHIQFPRPASEV